MEEKKLREAFEEKPVIDPLDETEEFNNYLRSKVHNTRIRNQKMVRNAVEKMNDNLEGLKNRTNIREHK